MESDDSGGPGEREPVEREALDGLRVTSLDGFAPGDHRAGRAWRWGLRLGGVMALLGLLAVAAVALSPLLAPLLPRPTAPKARKAPPLDITALQIPSEARSCIAAGAWSPDGRWIAIVRENACDSGAAQGQPAPTALIFDSATGHLANEFSLDARILQATAPAEAQTPDSVELDGVTWTPDGLRIATPFVVFPASGSGAMTFGLALLTVRGAYIGDFQSVSETIRASTLFDPLAQTSSHIITVWAMSDTSMDQRALTVAPAYAYRWGADGALEPLAPPTTPTPRGGQSSGVALPDGFSMWLSGQVREVNAISCADPKRFLPQPYIALSLSTLAWSPDGRYLAAASGAGRYDEPGAPTTTTPEPPSAFAACSGGPAPESLPPGPTHDAGLRSALALAASPGMVSVDLEWRPDGQRLAALTFDASATGSAIALYDCRTGALLRRYTAGQFPINGPPGTGPAKNFDQAFIGGAWSPDGRRLLVEAVGTGAVPFIMNPGALG